MTHSLMAGKFNRFISRGFESWSLALRKSSSPCTGTLGKDENLLRLLLFGTGLPIQPTLLEPSFDVRKMKSNLCYLIDEIQILSVRGFERHIAIFHAEQANFPELSVRIGKFLDSAVVLYDALAVRIGGHGRTIYCTYCAFTKRIDFLWWNISRFDMFSTIVSCQNPYLRPILIPSFRLRHGCRNICPHLTYVVEDCSERLFAGPFVGSNGIM